MVRVLFSSSNAALCGLLAGNLTTLFEATAPALDMEGCKACSNADALMRQLVSCGVHVAV